MIDIESLAEKLEAARLHHARDQMAGSLDALSAVIDHLRAQGLTSGQVLPLVWLAHALTEKDTGKPLFEIGQWTVAAVAVDLLMEAGQTLDRSCHLVSAQTGGRLSPSSVKDYRKNMRSGRAKKIAQDAYVALKREMRGKLVEKMASNKADWRRPILETVADSFGVKV